MGPAKIVRQLGVARSIVYRNKASDEQRVNDCKVPQVLRDPPGYRACRPGTLPLAHALPEVWRPDQDGHPLQGASDAGWAVQGAWGASHFSRTAEMERLSRIAGLAPAFGTVVFD